MLACFGHAPRPECSTRAGFYDYHLLIASEGVINSCSLKAALSHCRQERRLSRIADQAIADSFAAVRTGDTELDIAAVLTRRVYELGAENFKLLIVATGERSQLPNVGPTSRKLQSASRRNSATVTSARRSAADRWQKEATHVAACTGGSD